MLQEVMKQSICFLFRQSSKHRISSVAIHPRLGLVNNGCTKWISTSTVLGFQKMIRRDKHRRKCVAQYEGERLRLRAIVKNNLLPEIVQEKAKKDLASHPRDAYISRVRNRCVVTGRARGVITEYGLCRMKFRQIADFGHVSGLTRSSW